LRFPFTFVRDNLEKLFHFLVAEMRWDTIMSLENSPKKSGNLQRRPRWWNLDENTLSPEKSGSRSWVYDVCMLKRRWLHAWFIGFFWLLFRVGVKGQPLGIIRRPSALSELFSERVSVRLDAGWLTVVITTAGTTESGAVLYLSQPKSLKWKRILATTGTGTFFPSRRYRVEHESSEVCVSNWSKWSKLICLSLSLLRKQTNPRVGGRKKKKKEDQTSTQFAAVQERGGWIFIFVATLSM